MDWFQEKRKILKFNIENVCVVHLIHGQFECLNEQQKKKQKK